MTALTLPALLPIRSLLEDLLGREVIVGHADPVMADELPTTTVAIYVGNGMQLAAVVGLDLPLAAYAGAALGLMPVGGAEDSIDAEELSPVLAENVHELCNILTGLLNRGGAPHVKLHQVWLPGREPAPNDAAALLLALGRRLDVRVEIARYGGGRLSLSLAP